MPIETNRLKLPLPLGNESVSRVGINNIFEKIDEGVATLEEVEELRQSVSEMDIPDASLTEKGKVQLSSKTNGDREDVAATEKAVGLAFQAGVERKSEVVAALNSIGVSASTSETWAQLINKMAGVIRATGNATAAQVLTGATFSNGTGNGRVGTMPDRSAEAAHQLAKLTEVWQGDRAFFMPPDGYFDGQSWVYALTPDLLPANLRAGKSVLGVVGTLQEGAKYATGVAMGISPGLLFNEISGTFNAMYIAVTNLSFRPKQILIRRQGGDGAYVTTYYNKNQVGSSTQYPYNWSAGGMVGSGVLYTARIYDTEGTTFRSDSGLGGQIIDNGFRLPVMNAGANYVWEAFG
nr:phage tail protein [Paenibacillus xylanexedens]